MTRERSCWLPRNKIRASLPAPRPFLKWAGGKGQLLNELVPRILAAGSITAYHEPFLGGGAVFFELARTGKLPDKVYLSDINTRLMSAYLGVRDCVEKVLARLQVYAQQHNKDHYYQVRAESPDSLSEQAARIIYLNRTCFNGLFRENSRGQFNVPMGRYLNPCICDPVNLRACSEVLKRADLQVQPFAGVLKVAKPGDLVYFDPPYVPLSRTSSFTSYNKDGFKEEDQRTLANVCQELARRGVWVLLSNSMTPLVESLYKVDFRIEVVHATRNVNSRADARGKVAEALISNIW